MNTPRFLDVQIEHPRKTVVPLAVGLGWGNDGAIYQEKLDGVFMTRTILGGIVVAGEQMRGGEFVAWDLFYQDYQDVRGFGAWERFNLLQRVCQGHGLRLVQWSFDGGKLLETVLARGGEGIVRKLLGATYFEAMIACKRLQTWVCRVVALDHATGGAAIADAVTGENRGTVPLRNRAGQCRVGSIVKVEGLELTAAGKIRDPRPCKDTPSSWLIRF